MGEEFAGVRMKYYDLRKKYLIDKLTLERDLLNNRARFIAMIIAKKLHINNRKKADVVKDLIRFKFMKFGDTKPPRTGFEYLLIMQIASLTKERKEELEKMAKEKAAELEKVKRTSIQAMWLEDLKNLEAAIQRLYESEEAQEEEGTNAKGKRGTKRKAAEVKAPKRKGKTGAEDDEADGGEDEADANIDPMDNPFGDIARWTSGALKAISEAGGPMKKRRTK